MATNIVRESAKIYEFPVRNIQRLKDAQESRPRPLIYDSGCGSWYHEDAIREEEEARKQ